MVDAVLSLLMHPTGVARLKCCNNFSCGVDILSAPDGQDAHPTRVFFMHYFWRVSPLREFQKSNINFISTKSIAIDALRYR